MGPNPGGASLCLGAILAEQGQRRVTGRLQPNGSAYPGDVSEEGGRHASEWVAGEGRLASAVYWRRKGHEHPAAGAAQAGRCRFLRRARMPPDLGHLPPPPPEPRRSLLQSYSPGHGRTDAFRGERVCKFASSLSSVCILPCRLHCLLERCIRPQFTGERQKCLCHSCWTQSKSGMLAWPVMGIVVKA
jgi:hypothetical protein